MHRSLKVSGAALMVALLATLPASAVSINLGGDGGLLGGGTDGGATATVNTGLLNDSGDAAARVDLGNGLLGSDSDPTTANVDLFGVGDQPTNANVTLGGGADGTNGDVLLDLFGNGASSGSDSNARIALGTGGAGTGDSGNAAALDLFGPADGTGAGDGTSASGAGGGASGSARTVGTVQIAAVGNIQGVGNCFTPSAEQQAKLVARHDYAQSTASWGGIGQLKVVDVGLCSSAGASIVRESNIGRLQAYVTAHPEIRSGLDKLGRSPSEVIAGDKNGDTLTLYVM